jgi:hypothetical protein
MNKYLRFLAAPVLLGLSLQTALSLQTVQAADLSAHPGYLDPDQLSFIDGRQANVEVTLYGAVLNMLLQLPIEYDEGGQVRELLKVVDQILVRIYTMSPEQAQDTLALIGETSASLEEQDWVRIVRVRDQDDSNVDIHVKLSADGENLTGLVIMAVENDGYDDAEVVFVNIAGNFNPAYLANIGRQFDIDYLEGVQVP